MTQKEFESLKGKVIQELLNACLEHYNAELALCEPARPRGAEERSSEAYNKFVWHCQDYIDILSSDADSIAEIELNFNYL